MRAKHGITKAAYDEELKEVAKLSKVSLHDREKAILALRLAVVKSSGDKIFKDGYFIIQTDQNPERGRQTSTRNVHVSPCVTPSGRFYSVVGRKFLGTNALAALQGYSPTELREAIGDAADDPSFAQNLLGNAFSTNVVAAVLLAVLMIWERSVGDPHRAPGA